MRWILVSFLLAALSLPFGAQAAWCDFWGTCPQTAATPTVQPTVRRVVPSFPSVQSWSQIVQPVIPSVTQTVAPSIQHSSPSTQPAAPSTQPAAPSTQHSSPSTQHSVSSAQIWVQNANRIALERLGEKIFFDKNLSALRTQSCASCHDANSGFTDPDAHDPTSLGGDGVSFGTRNSPTLTYVGHIPNFELAMRPNPFLSAAAAAQNNPGIQLTDLPLPDMLALVGQNIVMSPQSFGGYFLDGRAATLEEQAKVPFFAANEMGLNSPEELAIRMRWTWYSWEFMRQFGYDVFNDSSRTLDGVATALAAFQRSKKFAPFTSKFDRVVNGTDSFSASEARGHALFNGNGCVFCHSSPQGNAQLFSDFAYHNVGTPKNYTLLNNIGNPAFVDRGRGAISGNPVEEGMFRTPTLRNVAKTAPYMHNGVFNTLHEVVNFYNTRDIAVEPELRTQFVTPSPLIGNLGLTDSEVNDIVAFLRALSDE